jgi:hypothetical protein
MVCWKPLPLYLCNVLIRQEAVWAPELVWLLHRRKKCLSPTRVKTWWFLDCPVCCWAVVCAHCDQIVKLMLFLCSLSGCRTHGSWVPHIVMFDFLFSFFSSTFGPAHQLMIQTVQAGLFTAWAKDYAFLWTAKLTLGPTGYWRVVHWRCSSW